MKIKLIAPARKPEWGESFWDLKTLNSLMGKKAAGVVLALPTLAALTPKDVEVVITDENIEHIDFDEDVDLVGISFLTSLTPRAYEVADKFRSRGVKVVLGGIHTSMMPKEASMHADCVVVGEAEEIWLKLINDFKKGNLKKIYEAPKFPSLIDSPMPRWDLLKTDKYACFTVQTGRGCPYSCDFCSVRLFNGSRYRHKPISNVIEEIKLLKSIDPKKTILFADDNFLAIPRYAKKLLQEIKRVELKKWWCQTSVNRLKDEELLDLLSEAGCESVFVGFESVSQDSLDSIKKVSVNKVQEYKEVIQKTHRKGIAIFGSFMFGSDADKTNIFEETREFIKETKVPFSMINYLTPTPGSVFYDKLLKDNRLLHFNWQKYNGENLCFEPKKMSRNELINGRNNVLREIYSFDSLSDRLNGLWKDGVFLRKKNKKRFSKGRLLFSVKAMFEENKKKRNFIIRGLWNKKITSIGPISLALNFHDYANNNKDQKTKKIQ